LDSAKRQKPQILWLLLEGREERLDAGPEARVVAAAVAVDLAVEVEADPMRV
jgi:hypothetical protein